MKLAWRGPTLQGPTIVRAAVVGPAGPSGPAGPQGAVGSPQQFNISAAATWSITHGLGRTPLVAIHLVGGEMVIADVVANPTQVVVTHAQPVAGFILCT